MQQWRIGLIGSGGRGRMGRHAHKPESGTSVVACCDVKEVVFAKNREMYGPEIYTTDAVEALLKQELDAVMICSPDWFQEEQATKSLRSDGQPQDVPPPSKGITMTAPTLLVLAARIRKLVTAGVDPSPLWKGQG